MKKRWRLTGIILITLILLMTASFTVWASIPARPDEYALKSLNSTENTNFQTVNEWLVFYPYNTNAEMGLVFYPGGRVDARAYAPYAQAISDQGYLVVIVPMPLNLAFFGINRASAVMDAYPEINHWVVGGHSLGGAMAAEFAAASTDRINGLTLWASYPGQNNDLSNTPLPVLSIYASNDGLATPGDILESKDRLPADATFIEIIGGNHAGFGWYGDQQGDGILQISHMEQQKQVVQAIINFLEAISYE